MGAKTIMTVVSITFLATIYFEVRTTAWLVVTIWTFLER
jgi:hypothetical protein